MKLFSKFLSKRNFLSFYHFIYLLFPLSLTFILTFQYLIPNWEKYKKNQEILKTKINLLLQYKKNLKNLKNLPIKNVKEDPYKYLFTGKDPYVAISELQKDFEVVENLKVRSFRIVSQNIFKKEIKKIEILFELEGDIKTLGEMLEILENFKKAIVIKQLIASKQNRRRDILRISLRLEALFLQIS